MKTTVDIAQELFVRVRKTADAQGVTFKAFLESALWQALRPQPVKKKKRKMKDMSVKGQGVQPGIDVTNWEQMRAMAYEGRGG